LVQMLLRVREIMARRGRARDRHRSRQEIASGSVHRLALRCTNRALFARVKTNVNFQIENVPADGIRLPFSASGDFGTSPSFGQLSVKPNCTTMRQGTTFLPHKIGSQETLRERYARTASGLPILQCAAVKDPGKIKR
jgi:hypothetical protein